MSISAGAIVKFNCCQEGRDLPEDNKRSWDNGEFKYTYCPFHYFLIISIHDNNNYEHDAWKESGEKYKIKLCVAIPLDIHESKDDLNPFSFFLNGNLVETSQRMQEEYNSFISKKNKKVMCDKICKLNINRVETDTICFVPPDTFNEINKKLSIFVERGKKQTIEQIKSYL